MKRDEYKSPSKAVKTITPNVAEVEVQNAFSILDVDELSDKVEVTHKEDVKEDIGAGIQGEIERNEGGGNLAIPNG